MTKRYFWLKLPEEFFDDDTVRFIEEQENGIAYSNFYLKLCLKALKSEGKLIRVVGDKYIPYDTKALSKLTGVPIDTVANAMRLFGEIGLIEFTDTKEIYLRQLNELIGSETEKAKLMRRKRAQEKAQISVMSNNVTKTSNIVTNSGNNVQKCYLYKEKEIDIEKKINTLSGGPDYVKQIVEYLNERTGKKYRVTNRKTKSLIESRVKEGFTIEDFEKVIDTKTKTWKGTDMEKYLRPETLFGSKFEGYLNEESHAVNTDVPDWYSYKPNTPISDETKRELAKRMERINAKK